MPNRIGTSLISAADAAGIGDDPSAAEVKEVPFLLPVRVGLLATQGIRGGDNRRVLERINETGGIFMAWSDREWILDGAAVHVSMVGFDDGTQTERTLDGQFVPHVNADLTGGVATVEAKPLAENAGIAFMGDTKGGAFDIGWEDARRMLGQPNPHGQSNFPVVRPWLNGSDITKRTRSMWIIDFGCEMPMDEAAKFESPFRWVEQNVKPDRIGNRRETYAQRWWIHVEPRPAMRRALPASGCIVTPNVTKFRLFAKLDDQVLPDHQLITFARSDDYFFGVLHSSIHELWARRMGTQLREAESGFRYTPTTCFETFPLPWGPGREPCPFVECGSAATALDGPVTSAPPTAGASLPHSTNRNSSPAAEPPAKSPCHESRARRPCYEEAGCAREEMLVAAIAAAARELNEQRERWLNPPEWIGPIAASVDQQGDFSDVPEPARALIRQSAIMARAAQHPQLKKRTLTNLYNERPTWLRLAHKKLDAAVLAAYAAADPAGGWSAEWAAAWEEAGAGQAMPDGHPLAGLRAEIEQKVLGNLLRLNGERGERTNANGK
ncbi:MAG: hypothetical protein PHU85_17195 [Phycisphaerae bacterium]|nr:hypothetical protein [Phycisphaerae bacterium]